MNRVNENKASGVQLRAWQLFSLVTFVSIALNIILHTNFRTALVNRYPGDSIYTLSTTAGLGLAAISTTLLVLILLLSWFCTTKWIIASQGKSLSTKSTYFVLDLWTTGAVYLLMLVLAPQVFYIYYLWVFAGLPVQWVISPMTWDTFVTVVTVPSGGSMAEHSAGIALWVLLFNTVFQWVSHRLNFVPSIGSV